MAAAAHALAWLRIDALKKYELTACLDDALRVGTSEIVLRENLLLDASIKESASKYEATPPFRFRHAMSALDIECDRYRFIDYGSGKGRVLLLASEFPFIEIRGIEGDRQLHDIACRNIAAFPRDRMACRKVESICMNVTEWDPQTGPLVAYMYNPFDQIILATVLRRILLRPLTSPQASYLIYLNPVHHETVLSNGHFSCIENLTGGKLRIYKISP